MKHEFGSRVFTPASLARRRKAQPGRHAGRGRAAGRLPGGCRGAHWHVRELVRPPTHLPPSLCGRNAVARSTLLSVALCPAQRSVPDALALNLYPVPACLSTPPSPHQCLSSTSTAPCFLLCFELCTACCWRAHSCDFSKCPPAPPVLPLTHSGRTSEHATASAHSLPNRNVRLTPHLPPPQV